jgi:tetratricopeptide (TPR) repeat protein
MLHSCPKPWSARYAVCGMLLPVAILTILAVFSLAAAGPITDPAGSPSREEIIKMIEKGKLQEARAVLEQMIKADPRNHEAYYGLSTVYLFEGNWDKSIDYGEKAVDLSADSSAYHQRLGEACVAKALHSNRITAVFLARRGESEVERAVELDSANVEARVDLFQFYLDAPGIVGGDKDKAKEQAAIIQQLDPFEGAEAWASFWEASGNLESAEAFWREAARLDTSSTFDAGFGLGSFLRRNGEYGKAAKVFEEILTANPREGNALFQLCNTYLGARDNLEMAEACFKKYLETEPSEGAPGWAYAHWGLAVIYQLQGKKELNLAELKKALELEPNHEGIKKAIEEAEEK